MGQFRFPLHEYVRFLRTERLKNDLQPEIGIGIIIYLYFSVILFLQEEYSSFK